MKTKFIGLQLVNIIIIILFLFSLNKVDQFFTEWMVLFGIYILCSNAFIVCITNHEGDLFEPFVLASIIMFLTFLITPMVDIINNNTSVFGINKMDYCIKGTILFAFAYFAFCIGYYRKRVDNNRYEKVQIQYLANQQAIAVFSVVLFVICFGFALIDKMTRGINLAYILSFGTGTQVVTGIEDVTVKFMGMFANSLIGCWLIYLVYGKFRIIKIVMPILALAMYIVGGSRYIIICEMAAPLIMYYVIKGKRPGIKVILPALIAVLFMIAALGYTRGAIRSNGNVTLTGMDFEYLMNNLLFNFGIYKSYYGVLSVIPSQLPFYCGRQLLYVVIEFIPRFLWANKPYSYQAEVIGAAYGAMGLQSGYAFPNLGEFYGDFGFFGSIICYFILGVVLRKWKQKYCDNDRNIFTVMQYAVLFGEVMQIIIRGAFYQYVVEIVFLLLPFILMKLLFINRSETGVYLHFEYEEYTEEN